MRITQMTIERRNFRIDNVELNWAKLDQPVSPFGTLQWELQIATTDKAKAKELSDNYFNVKEKDGKFVVSLKRKAVKSDGSENAPVRVVDTQLQPVDAKKIGNGSTGNVIVYQYPYEAPGRKGVASMLSGVQVVNLVEYNPSASGFDVIGDAVADTATIDEDDAPFF
jgi:hypothetical protein